MGRGSDIAVLDANIGFEQLPFRAPLKFGGRIMADTLIANTQLRVRSRSGKEAVGLGSMPLGNIWAWPSERVEPTTTARAMRRLAEKVVAAARDLTEPAHPLDLVHDLSRDDARLAGEVAEELELPEPIPRLAVLVAACTVDAALHDGFGKANGINSFHGLSAEYCPHDLSRYLDDDFRGEYLDRYTLRDIRPRMPLYHLVGALDPLTRADVNQPINEGLPETLGEWIARDGLTHLKIKLNGDDLGWDVARVVRVEHVAEEVQGRRRCDQWHYSLDFNEKCRDVEYVLEFLARLGEDAPLALERVQYIEQPTHRDLAAHPENRMHRAAALKPVVIDESLVDYESYRLAREQGYSGIALKACKGHTEALLMGAAAQKHGLFLCVQDLTCPGASFLHSAELAARIPGIAAIEGNGRQYCPLGNQPWVDRFPSMFQITDGTVGTYVLDGIGLGH